VTGELGGNTTEEQQLELLAEELEQIKNSNAFAASSERQIPDLILGL
jgi:spermidine/putrescine-binding protein